MSTPATSLHDLRGRLGRSLRVSSGIDHSGGGLLSLGHIRAAAGAATRRPPEWMDMDTETRFVTRIALNASVLSGAFGAVLERSHSGDRAHRIMFKGELQTARNDLSTRAL